MQPCSFFWIAEADLYFMDKKRCADIAMPFKFHGSLSVALSAVVNSSHQEGTPYKRSHMAAASEEEGINSQQDGSWKGDGIQDTWPKSSTFSSPLWLDSVLVCCPVSLWMPVTEQLLMNYHSNTDCVCSRSQTPCPLFKHTHTHTHSLGLPYCGEVCLPSFSERSWNLCHLWFYIFSVLLWGLISLPIPLSICFFLFLS